MTRTIEVMLGEDARRVGILRYDAQGGRESASFEYVRDWISTGHPLAPDLPLLAGPQFHKRTRVDSPFHDAIADTEPDGWGKMVILRDHAKRRRTMRTSGTRSEDGTLTSLDFLLAVDDGSRAGALRFRDEQGVFRRAPEAGRRTTPPLVELGALSRSTRAVELNTETQADLAYLRGRGTSLGGLRPKCTVIDDDGRLAIGKFPSVQDQG
jgi:serine/threonine-protein kinase HipA